MESPHAADVAWKSRQPPFFLGGDKIWSSPPLCSPIISPHLWHHKTLACVISASRLVYAGVRCPSSFVIWRRPISFFFHGVRFFMAENNSESSYIHQDNPFGTDFYSRTK